MIRVMLVDDHTILRDGLKNIFELEPYIKVVGEAVTGDEAMKRIKELMPDVILMDINLPGVNGVEITAQIKEKYPLCKILILTMYNHEEYFLSALRAGADGYLLKDSPSQFVIDAIRTVARGESVLHPTMTKKLLTYHQQQHQTKTSQSELTDREREVLVCLVQGLNNKEVAERLFISEKTVKIHVSKIFKKLNVKSRSQAVIYAVQNQLFPLL